MTQRTKDVLLALYNMMDLSYTYLDYNSTTPVDPRVLKEMLPFLQGDFANPSSTHKLGIEINKKVNYARNQIADFIKANPKELVFTSGATEAINIAIRGVAEGYSNKGKHIITVSTEHKAVIDTCADLEKRGFEITYLPVNPNGIIDVVELQKAVRDDTILVSVMLVNNETGVIQPLRDIASITKEKGVLLMTDATQAIGKLEIDVDDLAVDLLCFSGHKMYAPKGIGALYFRTGTKLTPQIHGGGHERGLRSGTLNVSGIVSLAKACSIAIDEMVNNQIKIQKLRDELELELLKLSITSLNGHLENRVYNTSNICFKGHDANVLIGRMENIAVSNGSACSAAIVKPSHVLKAMGLEDDDALGSLRFSLGKFNTKKDINTVVQKLKEII